MELSPFGIYVSHLDLGFAKSEITKNYQKNVRNALNTEMAAKGSVMNLYPEMPQNPEELFPVTLPPVENILGDIVSVFTSRIPSTNIYCGGMSWAVYILDRFVPSDLMDLMTPPSIRGKLTAPKQKFE
jgi:hypothetical protein